MSIDIEKITYPFYKVTFLDAPTNYFSLCLFGHYGKINIDLYNKELDNFKKILKTSDPYFKEYTISEKYKDSNIPKDSFLFSFIKDISDYISNNKNLYDYIINIVTDEKYSYDDNFVLNLLSYYFNFGYELYNSDSDLIENIPLKSFFHSQSEIKIKFYVDRRFRLYPILKSNNNGDIFRDYVYLNR